MLTALSILGLLCVAIAMGLALAHALELPGKLRLDRKTYEAVQAIYYPGFTLGGLVGELGGMAVLAAVLVLSPARDGRFWCTAVALGLLACVHAVYWLVTHPLNNFWVSDVDMPRPASRFFSAFARHGGDWTARRGRWEASHVLRAALAMASLVAMSIALTR